MCRRAEEKAEWKKGEEMIDKHEKETMKAEAWGEKEWQGTEMALTLDIM